MGFYLFGCRILADEASVEGVNLDIPGSAKLVIKTWDERLSDEIVESGVDDEVSHSTF